jgi:glycolate oxidase iron-sulfur subunit
MKDANICCGGGGSFQFDFPQISKGITENKLKNIRETGASILVTGCPGCRVTIAGNLTDQDHIQVLHPLQLVDNLLSEGGSEKRYSFKGNQ